MAPSLCHSLEPSLLLLQLNKPSFTSAPTVPVLPPASEAAGASAWCERQQQPISRLHSLWSLYRGGAQAECNHVASQDRELIWLKITYACWLSFQLLQVPDLVHQSLVPTQDRRRRYMEMSGHRNTCERCTKQYHWLRSHAQQRHLCTAGWKAQRKNWFCGSGSLFHSCG